MEGGNYHKGKRETSEKSAFRAAEKQTPMRSCQKRPLVFPQRTLISLGHKVGGKLHPLEITRQERMLSAFLKLQPPHLPSTHPHPFLDPEAERAA